MQLQDSIRESGMSVKRVRPLPDGDFSSYLPDGDPIRLELESLFPPFTPAEDAAGSTAG